jgi:hypothetical protein
MNRQAYAANLVRLRPTAGVNDLRLLRVVPVAMLVAVSGCAGSAGDAEQSPRIQAAPEQAMRPAITRLEPGGQSGHDLLTLEFFRQGATSWWKGAPHMKGESPMMPAMCLYKSPNRGIMHDVHGGIAQRRAAHTAMRAAIVVALSAGITVPTLGQEGANRGDSVTVVSVKFREGLRIRTVAGKFRTVVGLPRECLQDLAPQAMDSCRTPSKLRLWYRLFVPATADVNRLIAELNALAEVDTAYAAPKPVRPPRGSTPPPRLWPEPTLLRSGFCEHRRRFAEPPPGHSSGISVIYFECQWAVQPGTRPRRRP